MIFQKSFMHFYSPSWKWSTDQVSTHLDQYCDCYRHLYFWQFPLTSKVFQSKRNFVFFFQFHLFVKWNFRKTESVIAFHKLLRNSGNNPRGGTRPYPFVMQNFTNVCIQGYKFLFTSPNLVFCLSKYRVSYSNSMLYTLYKYGICL